MASVQKRGNGWQLRVKNKLLPKPFFHTFPTEEEATSYGEQLEAVLARGIVPVELLSKEEKRADNPPLSVVIKNYMAQQSYAPTDEPILQKLRTDLAQQRLAFVTFQWAQEWVRQLKVHDNLAPGTIRKRVESLARVIDWHLLNKQQLGEAVLANPLRLLPRGYSLYSKADAALAEKAGKKAKVDKSRDFRLSPEQEQAVIAALTGHKRPDRQRPFPTDDDFRRLYLLIVDTGLRLSEAYKLRTSQLDFARGVINVEGSKGHRGKIKPRFCPMKPNVAAILQEQAANKDGLIFPFWSGHPEDLRKTTNRLSARFASLFDYAGVPHLTEHDLRHEATCRWVLLRKQSGELVFSDIEICRIMGWSDTKMMLKYASLRGDGLSSRLSEQTPQVR